MTGEPVGYRTPETPEMVVSQRFLHFDAVDGQPPQAVESIRVFEL